MPPGLLPGRDLPVPHLTGRLTLSLRGSTYGCTVHTVRRELVLEGRPGTALQPQPTHAEKVVANVQLPIPPGQENLPTHKTVVLGRCYYSTEGGREVGAGGWKARHPAGAGKSGPLDLFAGAEDC